MTALIPCIVLMLAGADITVHSLCLYAAIGMSATLLAGGISLPCAYLFDPEKSQVVFMMSFMASTGIIVGLVLLTNLFIPVKNNPSWCWLLISFLSFPVFVFSSHTELRRRYIKIGISSDNAAAKQQIQPSQMVI